MRVLSRPAVNFKCEFSRLGIPHFPLKAEQEKVDFHFSFSNVNYRLRTPHNPEPPFAAAMQKVIFYPYPHPLIQHSVTRFGCILAALIANLLPLTAAIPTVIPYHGRVAVNGTPFTGTGQFRFALTNDDGSTVHWDSGSAFGSVPVDVVAGDFDVRIGDASLPNMADIPLAVFDHSPLYLRVWFSDGNLPEAELLPATRLLAVPFAIVAATVQDGAITSDKLADGAVMPGKIGTGAVGEAQIFQAAVKTNALGDGAVTSIKLADAAVTSAKIAPGAVDSLQLADGAVTAAKIADEAVDSGQLAPFAVGSNEMKNGAVTNQKIADNAVTERTMANQAVTAAKLASGAVGSSALASGAVGTPAIADGSVTVAKLAPGAIQSAISNSGLAALPSNVTVVSPDPEDDDLIAAGWLPTGARIGRPPAESILLENPEPITRGEAYSVPTPNGFYFWGGRDRPILPDYVYKPELTKLIIGDSQNGTPWRWENFGTPSGAPLPTANGVHLAIDQGRYFTWSGWGVNFELYRTGGVHTHFQNWTLAPVATAPPGRVGAGAVWTGSEVIIHGGRISDTERAQDVWSFNPQSNSWAYRGEFDIINSISGHSLHWHNGEIFTWSGNQVAAFDPSTGTDRLLPNTNAPSGGVAAWQGDQLIVVVLDNGSDTLTAHQYGLDTQTWQETAQISQDFSAVDQLRLVLCNGVYEIIFEGGLGSHPWLAYDPATRKFLDREVEVYIGDFWPATFHIQPAWNGTHLVFPDDASTDPALRGTILNPPEPSLYLYQKP